MVRSRGTDAMPIRRAGIERAVRSPLDQDGEVMAAATATVESLCNALVKSRLLQPNDVKALYQRWRTEAKTDAGSTEKFTRWLVLRQYLTEYQATLLGRGQVDNFFLNDYKILDRIGAGRMAGIFKAIHAKGAVVAVKVLPPSRSRNLEMFSRFQREARMAMKLKHANIVRTFQVSECRTLHFIVMEYLEGETLEEVIKKRGKLPPVEAVRLIHQALLGLQHIHEQGIVHRDLKPANLMLVPPPRADSTLNSTVKILDIGLGKVMFDEEIPGGLQEVQLTSDGAILGAPEYMAPEQAKDAHNADIRSDIYSLGCTLYHCLAGQPPFPDVNMVRVMVRHATETPKPLREFNPQVPDGLQQIVLHMLAKDPSQRYQTPDRAAKALEVFLAAAGDAARPLEAEPGMRDYLNWLDAQPAPADASPVPAAPRRGAPAAPAPSPVMPYPQPVGISASAADVELVPQGGGLAPPRPLPEQTNLGRKDMLLLGIIVGIGMVILAGLVAFLLHMLLRRG
jgi:tRNA A-37 threonylcarbamoyl transferase component Bud32